MKRLSLVFTILILTLGLLAPNVLAFDGFQTSGHKSSKARKHTKKRIKRHRRRPVKAPNTGAKPPSTMPPATRGGEILDTTPPNQRKKTPVKKKTTPPNQKIQPE